MDREVANVLFYANHILYNFQKRTTIKNLFYHVRYQDATGLEHLAYFDLKSPEKVDHQRALDLAKELSDRALDIPLEESVWYRSSQEEELYLQRKRFSMREGDVDLLLAMGVDRKHYFTHDGYAWFVNGFFWLGMGVFGILFYWLFRSWLLLPIERIAQRMHDKDPIPLSFAGKAKELVTLLETHNRLLEELQKENEFSKMLLDSQDQFIKDSIHDINTPLSVILLNVGLLELEVGENEYLLHIKSGIRSLQHVYGDLSYLLDKEAKEGEGEEGFDLSEVLR
jgi:signal transduction histidine kinase